MIGAVQEITIVHAHHQGLDPATTSLRKVMARPLPLLDVRASLEEAYRLLLAGNSAVMVSREQTLVGLITRADLMAFYEAAKQTQQS
jgi:cystathionine beta-synthase